MTAKGYWEKSAVCVVAACVVVVGLFAVIGQLREDGTPAVQAGAYSTGRLYTVTASVQTRADDTNWFDVVTAATKVGEKHDAYYAERETERRSMSMKRNVDITGKIKAPSLSGAVGWLNIARGLDIEDLRGKVVLLDFWTYCCINCMHIIPDLKRLEEKYGSELVVIGVHSAKFANEKESANIREAILRYGIEHPVANDADFVIWKKFGVTGWPNLVVIDPEGKIVGTLSGEGNYDVLDDIIGGLVERFEGKLDRRPISLSLEKDREESSFLAYPGKVLADEAGGRIFVADSGHNRVLVTDMEGQVIAVAGSGKAGKADGGFGEAQFQNPQGMALDGESLFVADTDNHLLRRLDLTARTVETVAGTGEQSRVWRGGEALGTALNSPWDIIIAGAKKDMYIAMAGSHQIWVWRRVEGIVEPFAGSGRENIVDGALDEAALAQPSGMATDGKNLYFADSEVSGLRMVEDFEGAARVKTLIGKGLFDFGDVDGRFAKALLQHPLGVAYHEGTVYVADTYNDKVKAADVAAGRIETFVGGGGAGTAGTAQFYEPGGLSIAGGKLYVADTNNQAVRVVDLTTRRVTTIEITMQAEASAGEAFDVTGSVGQVDLGGREIPAGGRMSVTFEMPEGYHFNELALPSVQIKATAADGETWVGKRIAPTVEGDTVTFDVSTGEVKAPARIEAHILYYYCRADGTGQCKIGTAVIDGAATHGVASTETLTLTYKVAE